MLLKVEWRRYALLDTKLSDLGQQLAGYYDGDLTAMSYETRMQLKSQSDKRYMDMDMFLVKVSDFMYTVPNVPHLHNVRITITYKEVPEESKFPFGPDHYRQDPDAARFHGFCPRGRHYVNGLLVDEDLPTPHQVSRTPFPESRVPRRGFVQVYPNDPDYARICVEQGLEHLLYPHPKTNGVCSPSATAPQPPQTLALGTNGTNGPMVTHATDAEMTNGKDAPNGTMDTDA
jgi:hypothetical protein